MKLNLLPSGAKKGGSPVLAWATAGLLVVGSLVATAAMAFLSSAALQTAKEEAIAIQPQAAEAVKQAKYAQLIVDSTQGVARNIELEKAMSDHNLKYTRFYRQVGTYIPSFLRVRRMQVRPINESSCALQVTGVLYSLQQHHDAQLALLRIPGAMQVGATGYAARPVLVPALSEDDQVGRAARIGSTPLPLDANERLNTIISRANEGTQGFENLENFGTEADFGPRGALPTGSIVTYTVILSSTGAVPAPAGAPGGVPAPGVPPTGAPTTAGAIPPGWDFNFLVPNPAQTIQAAGSATGGAPAAGGIPGGGTIPVAAGGLSGEAAARDR